MPLQLFTDSKSLFNAVNRSAVAAKTRLMVDTYSVRNAFHSRETLNVRFVRMSRNPADCIHEAI